MILVERGNRLPTVAVVQRLLNEAGTSTSRLVVDGDFGRLTNTAVREFQSKQGLASTGIVDPATWRVLSNGTGLSVIDHVDAAEDYHDRGTYRGYERDLLRTGADPIVSYDQSGRLGLLASQIRGHGRPGSVILLRFHGHGGPGVMGVSRGRGGMPHQHADSISLFPNDWAAVEQHFGPLCNLFAPLGSVELHGCSIAGDVFQDQHGRRRRVLSPSGMGLGAYMLHRLAELFGVPVSAATSPQYSHGRAILRFEGRVLTAFPNGLGTLAKWAAARASAS